MVSQLIYTPHGGCTPGGSTRGLVQAQGTQDDPNGLFLEEMYPEGLIANLERLTDHPIYITENGCAATDDRFRIVYRAETSAMFYRDIIRENGFGGKIVQHYLKELPTLQKSE